MGNQLNRQELAEHYDVSVVTVDTWRRRGMPYTTKGSRGKEWVFDSAEVAKWHAADAVHRAVGDVQDVAEEELKRRKLAAETTVAEIEAAKARGEVVLVDDVIAIIRDDYVGIKQRLRAIPGRVSPLIVGETDEERIRKELLNEIDEALSELANKFYSEGV